MGNALSAWFMKTKARVYFTMLGLKNQRGFQCSAHACSEIGVKWFLFLKHSQNTLIKQVHNGPKYAKTDSRPFLTVLGTHMRASAGFERSIEENASMILFNVFLSFFGKPKGQKQGYGGEHC
jgi:hypothetical protein